MTKTPLIIETANPTDDTVVADYVVTDTAYGADNHGIEDSSNAIQQAIKECAEAGGGTVWLPAGYYKITKPLYIKPYVTLRGEWRDPDEGEGDYGTVILADIKAGEDGDVVFEISGNAAVDGITVYYPRQSLENPVPYNYTFRVVGGENSPNWAAYRITNCTMLNSYNGIIISADMMIQHQTAHITDVKGTVLNIGMVSSNASNFDSTESVRFTPDYWANAGGRFNAPDRAALAAYTREHVIAFQFNGHEWNQVYGLSCSDVHVGIQSLKAPRIDTCMQALYCDIRNADVAVDIKALDYRWGISFVRSYLEGSEYAVNNTSRGYVQLVDCTLEGKEQGIIRKESPGTTPETFETKTAPKTSRPVMYNVKAEPYNAPSVPFHATIPEEDATAAIQKALDDAGAAGGGVVYLPAGWYCVKGYLTIPSNVELRGTSPTARDNPNSSKGTMIFCTAGAGTKNPETDRAIITMADGTNAGVRGIRFAFPDNKPQADGSVEPRPYVIRCNGTNAYVADVGLLAAYNGIDAKANRCDNVFIQNIQATILHTGIALGKGKDAYVDMVSTDHCMFARSVLPSYGYGNVQELMEYTRQNHTVVEVDGAPNATLLHVVTYAAHRAVYVKSGNADVYNVATDNVGKSTIEVESGNVRVMGLMRYNGITLVGNAAIYNEMNLDQQ